MAATIYSQLRPIAESILTAYLTDFTQHDKKTCRMMGPGETWVWVCRETGTHLQIINAPAEANWLTPQDLALSYDMLDALRGMGSAVKAIYLIETTEARRGVVTKLDAIPSRPAALAGISHGKKLLTP